jgi:hypothetical protein
LYDLFPSLCLSENMGCAHSSLCSYFMVLAMLTSYVTLSLSIFWVSSFALPHLGLLLLY